MRSVMFAITIGLAASASAGNDHHKPEPQAVSSFSASAALAGATGGSAYQEQTAVGSVQLDDSSVFQAPEFPVNTAARHEGGYCSSGGVSAQFASYGLATGQTRDPICARLAYKASLQAEADTLARVVKLLNRAPKATDPKGGPAQDRLTASLANSISLALAEKNERIEAQNIAIEQELKPGPFAWMRSVPILSLIAPSK